MQDYPKLLESCEKVGFTQIDKKFCFSTVKNDIQTAATKFAAKLSPESASSCKWIKFILGEHDVFWLNCELLKLAGVQFYGDVQNHSYAGINLDFPAKVSLHPEFGFTLEQIKGKIKGNVKISNSSSIYLGPNASLENVDIDGNYEINSSISSKELKNGNRLEYVELGDGDKSVDDYLKIRGYKSGGVTTLEKV